MNCGHVILNVARHYRERRKCNGRRVIMNKVVTIIFMMVFMGMTASLMASTYVYDGTVYSESVAVRGEYPPT